jgi:nitroimidazol reductase NimA-like FMN-containing flavoprotein (pyridoxamine 5'-phosphate oxidase superfamily)
MTTSPDSGIEELDETTCWQLLSTASLGRLAISTPDGPDIFPVNYLVKDEAIYFRSAPGSKLVELTEDPVVAFEADGVDDRKRWSVVVRGQALRLSLDTDIEDAGVLELAAMSPAEKWNFVRITPSTVSGRRFTVVHHTA